MPKPFVKPWFGARNNSRNFSLELSNKNPNVANIPGLDKALKNLGSDTQNISLSVYRTDAGVSLLEIADRYVVEVLIPSTWRRSKIKKHLEITVTDKSGGKSNARSETRKYDINSNGNMTPAAGDRWLARLRTARSILDAQQRTYVVLPTYWQWNLALEAFLPTYLFAGPFDIKKPVEIVSRIRELSDKINENPAIEGQAIPSGC